VPSSRETGLLLASARLLRAPIYRTGIRTVARKILPLFLHGTGVLCPCCGRSFRKFMRRYDWDALCPGCLSLSRHRLLWLYLRDETDVLRRPQALLHFAPEESIAARLRAARLRYVGADLYPRSPNVVRADVTAMPFEDEQFDVVLCNHVLEHVVDDRKAMAELYRVLKPGGRLYMLQPIWLERAETIENPAVTAPRERRRLFGQEDHVRIYGRDIVPRLASVGFEVRLEHYFRRIAPEFVEVYGLSDEPIFVCRKPTPAT
jgi:SAM-dependent methyltransferase